MAKRYYSYSGMSRSSSVRRWGTPKTYRQYANEARHFNSGRGGAYGKLYSDKKSYRGYLNWFFGKVPGGLGGRYRLSRTSENY